MGTFAYSAATAEGRTLRGVEEAVSASALERSLAARGLYPLDVAPATSEPSSTRGTGRLWRNGSRRADVAEAIATLASLCEAGLPLDRALDVAMRSAATAHVELALAHARRRIQEGGTVADALAEHTRLFPPIALGLIQAGERGGHLPQALARLAQHLDRERALRAQIFSAMLYPLLLIIVGAGVLAVLVFFVLPRFVQLLDQAGAELPRSTAILLGITATFGRTWPFLLAVVVGTAALLTAWCRTDERRERRDRMLLHLPLVGGLRARNAAARFSRTLATLLSGGLPMLPALEIAGHAAGDKGFARRVEGAREGVREGEPLAATLAASGAFPHVVVRMVEIGEETGQLDVLLERAATTLETELERRLERLVTLAEPALIVLFGLVVGFVALSLLQAIYGIHADTF